MNDNQPSSETKPRVHELFRQGEEDASLTSWRMFRIIAEFVSGFELLRKYGLAVSIYGSARAPDWSREYTEAEKLGRLLAGDGFAVITGGGGNGIMRAGNKGAYEAGGASIGLNIKLPKEQSLNTYVSDSMTFHFFFTRKVMLAFASEIYIFFPGGFGTLDEFFEILTLVQTGKIPSIPIILVGKEYWTPLIEWFKTSLFEKYRYVEENDLSIVTVVDSADEAFVLIQSYQKK